MGHKFNTQIVTARFDNNWELNKNATQDVEMASRAASSQIEDDVAIDGFKWPNEKADATRELPFS